MAQVAVTEADIIFVKQHIIRGKILQTLSGNKEYVSISDLAKSIGEKSGKVNFHCGELGDEGMVKSMPVKRQKYIKITEKGLLVWKEVERKQKDDQKP